MAFWIYPAVGAGLGLLKYLGDKSNEKRDLRMRALEHQLQFATHTPPTTRVRDANLIGDLSAGAMTGIGQGQNIQAMKLIEEGRYSPWLLGGIIHPAPSLLTGPAATAAYSNTPGAPVGPVSDQTWLDWQKNRRFSFGEE